MHSLISNVCKGNPLSHITAAAFSRLYPYPFAIIASADWLNATLAGSAILLAVLAVALMFRRVDVSKRQSVASDAESTSARAAHRDYPAVYYDPVLVVSALGVIGLAVAVWLLR